MRLKVLNKWKKQGRIDETQYKEAVRKSKDQIRLKTREIDKLIARQRQLQTAQRRTTDRTRRGVSSFKDMARSVIALTAAYIGLRTVVRSIRGIIDPARDFQTYELRLAAILGSFELARERLNFLAEYNKSTPFELPHLVTANIQLETLTKGALSAQKGLRLLSDVAVATAQPIEAIAFHVGRIYDGLKNQRLIGESLLRMQELGVLSGATRNLIEDLQKRGAPGHLSWKAFNDELERFKGITEIGAERFRGMISNLQDVLWMSKVDLGYPIIQYLIPKIGEVIEKIEELKDAGKFQDWGRNIVGWIDTLMDAIKGEGDWEGGWTGFFKFLKMNFISVADTFLNWMVKSIAKIMQLSAKMAMDLSTLIGKQIQESFGGISFLGLDSDRIAKGFLHAGGDESAIIDKSAEVKRAAVTRVEGKKDDRIQELAKLENERDTVKHGGMTGSAYNLLRSEYERVKSIGDLSEADKRMLSWIYHYGEKPSQAVKRSGTYRHGPSAFQPLQYRQSDDAFMADAHAQLKKHEKAQSDYDEKIKETADSISNLDKEAIHLSETMQSAKPSLKRFAESLDPITSGKVKATDAMINAMPKFAQWFYREIVGWGSEGDKGKLAGFIKSNAADSDATTDARNLRHYEMLMGTRMQTIMSQIFHRRAEKATPITDIRKILGMKVIKPDKPEVFMPSINDYISGSPSDYTRTGFEGYAIDAMAPAIKDFFLTQGQQAIDRRLKIAEDVKSGIIEEPPTTEQINTETWLTTQEAAREKMDAIKKLKQGKISKYEMIAGSLVTDVDIKKTLNTYKDFRKYGTKTIQDSIDYEDALTDLKTAVDSVYDVLLSKPSSELTKTSKDFLKIAKDTNYTMEDKIELLTAEKELLEIASRESTSEEQKRLLRIFEPMTAEQAALQMELLIQGQEKLTTNLQDNVNQLIGQAAKNRDKIEELEERKWTPYRGGMLGGAIAGYRAKHRGELYDVDTKKRIPNEMGLYEGDEAKPPWGEGQGWDQFAEVVNQMEEFQKVGVAAANVVAGAFQGLSTSIEGLIMGTMTWNDALRNLGLTILNSVVQAFSQMLASYILHSVIGLALHSKLLAALLTKMGVASASMTAMLSTPAALMSLATAGGNAAGAITAGATTLTFFKGLGTASKLIPAKEGGYTGDVPEDEVTGWHHGQEFVVKASATKRWRGLLENINAGAMPMADSPRYNTASSDVQTAPFSRSSRRFGSGGADHENGVSVAIYNDKNSAKDWLEQRQGRRLFMRASQRSAEELGLPT